MRVTSRARAEGVTCACVKACPRRPSLAARTTTHTCLDWARWHAQATSQRAGCVATAEPKAPQARARPQSEVLSVMRRARVLRQQRAPAGWCPTAVAAFGQSASMCVCNCRVGTVRVGYSALRFPPYPFSQHLASCREERWSSPCESRSPKPAWCWGSALWRPVEKTAVPQGRPPGHTDATGPDDASKVQGVCGYVG